MKKQIILWSWALASSSCMLQVADGDRFDWAGWQVEIAAEAERTRLESPEAAEPLLAHLVELTTELSSIPVEEGQEVQGRITLEYLRTHGDEMTELFQTSMVHWRRSIEIGKETLALAALPAAFFSATLLSESELRREIESDLGQDLDGVKAEIEGTVEAAADEMTADGFSIGGRVGFSDGTTRAAQELAHVVQQGTQTADRSISSWGGSIRRALDELLAKIAYLDAKMEALQAAYDSYVELYDAAKAGAGMIPAPRIDMFDILDAIREMNRLLTEVNECLESQGLDPIDYDDLQDVRDAREG